MDEILIELNILSQLPKDGRLCHDQDGTIALEKRKIFQNIRRTITGDGRRRSLNTVNRIINKALSKCDEILKSHAMKIYSLKKEPLASEIKEHNNCVRQLNRLIGEFRKSLSGIENLRETYKQDAMTVAQIDLITNKINETISDIEHNLENQHYKFIQKKILINKEPWKKEITQLSIPEWPASDEEYSKKS